MSEIEYRDLLGESTRILAQQQRIIGAMVIGLGFVLLMALSLGMGYRETVGNTRAEFMKFRKEQDELNRAQADFNMAVAEEINENAPSP